MVSPAPLTTAIKEEILAGLSNIIFLVYWKKEAAYELIVAMDALSVHTSREGVCREGLVCSCCFSTSCVFSSKSMVWNPSSLGPPPKIVAGGVAVGTDKRESAGCKDKGTDNEDAMPAAPWGGVVCVCVDVCVDVFEEQLSVLLCCLNTHTHTRVPLGQRGSCYLQTLGGGLAHDLWDEIFCVFFCNLDDLRMLSRLIDWLIERLCVCANTQKVLTPHHHGDHILIDRSDLSEGSNVHALNQILVHHDLLLDILSADEIINNDRTNLQLLYAIGDLSKLARTPGKT